MLPPRPVGAVEVCVSARIVCPRCKAVQRRLYVVTGVTVHHCATKIAAGVQRGERCDTYLGIVVTDEVAIVTALADLAAADEFVGKVRGILRAGRAVAVEPGS